MNKTKHLTSILLFLVMITSFLANALAQEIVVSAVLYNSVTLNAGEHGMVEYDNTREKILTIDNVMMQHVNIVPNDGYAVKAYNISTPASQVAAGNNFTLMLTELGQLYVIGYNGYGQLGTGNKNNITTYTQLQNPPWGNDLPVFITAGADTSYVLTTNGVIYAAGSNDEYEAGINSEEDTITTFTKVSNTPWGDDKPVFIAPCHESLAVLTQSGAIYTMGNNSYGQLGFDKNITISSEFKQIVHDDWGEDKPVAISAGSYHLIVLTQSGSIYSTGRNSSSQLGYSGSHSYGFVKLINTPWADDKPAKIFASGYQSFVITQKGEMYACGSNEYGQIGLTEEFANSIFTPISIPGDDDDPDTIYAGQRRTFVVTKNGKLFVAGDTNYAKSTTNENIYTFTNVPLPSGEDVAMMSLSNQHNVLLTQSGAIYVKGVNPNYLGLPTSNDVTTFTQTALLDSLDSLDGFFATKNILITALYIHAPSFNITAPESVLIGQQIEVTIQLVYADDVSGKSIEISSSNGTQTKSTNNDGCVTLTIMGDTVGYLTYNVTYRGDDNNKACQTSFSVDIVKYSPTLDIQLSHQSIAIDNEVTVTVTLSNADDVSNKDIDLHLYDYPIDTQKTDEYGVATFKITPVVLGDFPIRAHFIGDETNLSCTSETKTLSTIKRSPTLDIQVNPLETKYPNSMEAEIIITNTFGLTNKTIQLYVDGVLYTTGTLDNTGKAVINISLDSIGTHKVYAAFLGDIYNQPCQSQEVTLSLLKGDQQALTFVNAPNSVVYGEKLTINVTGGNGSGELTYATSDENVAIIDPNTGKLTIVGMGSFTITVTKASDNFYNEISVTSHTITVVQRQLSINVVIKPKAYDGTNAAEYLAVNLLGVVPGDDVVLTNGIAYFVSAEIGEKISIFMTNFSISGEDAYKYTLEQPSMIFGSITQGFDPINGTHYTTTPLNMGWTNSDFVITAVSGYAVGLGNKPTPSAWSDTLVLSGETDNGVAAFYMKNLATGEISMQKIELYKIDSSLPTAEVQYKTNGFRSFMNTISFNLFFKDYVNITISADDTASGVAQVYYYKAEKELNPAMIVDWVEGSTLNTTQREKFVLYVKVVDNAGNTAIFYDGVVVYTDSVQAVSGAYDKTTQLNFAIDVYMNGNTVKSIKNGAYILNKGIDYYTASNEIIEFHNAYMQTLNGDVQLEVEYYPLGETAEPDAISDVPATTVISLTIYSKPTVNATYGDKLCDIALPDGWSWADATAFVGNAGVQTHLASYNHLTNIPITVMVAPKAITITADNKDKIFGEADPTLTYTVNPALLDGDTLVGSLKYAGNDIGEYDIVQDMAFSNANYAITFISGKMTINYTAAMLEVIDSVQSLNPDNAGFTDDTADATNALAALTQAEKQQMPSATISNLEDMQSKAGEINNGANESLPWFVRLTIQQIADTDARYTDMLEKIGDKKLLDLFTVNLFNTLTNQEYLADDVWITLDFNANGETDIMALYLKPDGSLEELTLTLSSGKATLYMVGSAQYVITAQNQAAQESSEEPTSPTGNSTTFGFVLLLLTTAGIALAVKNRKKI